MSVAAAASRNFSGLPVMCHSLTYIDTFVKSIECNLCVPELHNSESTFSIIRGIMKKINDNCEKSDIMSSA